MFVTSRGGQCSISGRNAPGQPARQPSSTGRLSVHQRFAAAHCDRLPTSYITDGRGCFGAEAQRQHRTQRQGVACRYSLTVGGALASYDIPPQQQSEAQQHAKPDDEGAMPAWLSECISEAAKHLDQAPFLQLLLPGRASAFQRHRVTTAVVQAPQLWHGIAQHLAQAHPDVLVLIHPMHMAPASHSQRALQAARKGAAGERRADVLTGIAIGADWRAQHSAALEHTARALASGLAYPALSGRVGDCCDDEDELPFTNMLSARQQRGHSHAHGSPSRGTGASMETEYWGVVVQTKWRSRADGCYVLKTVRTKSGCECVHFSLVNVCKGEPYAAQMAASWLI